MKLECQSCGYEWDYQGESDYYATCPQCHYKVKITAKAKVVGPDMDINHFNEKEREFVKELARCEDEKDLKNVSLKYDQEEFNVLRKKIKEKAHKMRKKLDQYEKVEEIVENAHWDYPDL